MPLWIWLVGSMVLLVLVRVWFDRRLSGRDTKSHGDNDPTQRWFVPLRGPYDGGGL
jgi:hypothetical protein